MENTSKANQCGICKATKVVQECGACKAALCKQCTETIPKDQFSFLTPVPEELNHFTYCSYCYMGKVAPALAQYKRTMAKARNVYVFEKKLSEETRLMSRLEKPITVGGCLDRREALLRLAFVAAQAGFNALIDVDLRPTKVRNAGYQTSHWQCTGIPTQADAQELESKEKWRPSTYNF